MQLEDPLKGQAKQFVIICLHSFPNEIYSRLFLSWKRVQHMNGSVSSETRTKVQPGFFMSMYRKYKNRFQISQSVSISTEH